ncbi:LysR family transcriptional regulator [Kordiimonas gwangyangensis]|uniref:LysR family transcriptional regulator n=1 Tax=Kordiimonas gwangyangensis TaxID=288022 RepID=UPI000367A7BA|nr:LysR family transcriptional regulator [Kordiimonas gwangyangensis]
MTIPSHILTHLPFFAAVANRLSFTQAAADLNVGQSAISYQIRELEKKLGIRLIVRAPGSHVQLTAAGRALADDYAAMDRRLAVTLECLAPDRLEGKLTVTVPVDFGSIVMPHALARLAHTAPDLEVILKVSDDMTDMEREAVDLAIRSKPEGDGLVHRTLAHAPKRMVASSEYIAVHGTPESADDLKTHSLLLRGHNASPSWQNFLDAHGMSLADVPKVRVFSNSFALAEAARAGLGVALLPAFMVMDRGAGNLISLMDDAVAPFGGTFYISHLPLPQLSRRKQALVDAISDTLAAAPLSDAFRRSDT